MIFGISTWFFQELTVTGAIDRIARAGYRSAEVWAEHLLLTGESPESVGAFARERGLAVTLHAPSYDLNPTAINLGIRTESLRQIRRTIEVAPLLGAVSVVVHPGHLSSAQGDRERYWEDLHEMFVRVDGWAESAGVSIGIEAMERRSKELYMLPDDVRRMLSGGWRRIGLTLDIAHAYTHMDPVRFIEAVDAGWITHVHLSDGDERKTHLPLGKGRIDIASALNALRKKYDGIVSIEGYVPGQGDAVAGANIEFLRQHSWL